MAFAGTVEFVELARDGGALIGCSAARSDDEATSASGFGRLGGALVDELAGCAALDLDILGFGRGANVGLALWLDPIGEGVDENANCGRAMADDVLEAGGFWFFGLFWVPLVGCCDGCGCSLDGDGVVS